MFVCLFVLYSSVQHCTYFDEMRQDDIGRPWRGFRYLKYTDSSSSLRIFSLGTLSGYGGEPELSCAFARIRGDTPPSVVTRIRGKLTLKETSDAAIKETAVLGSLTSGRELGKSWDRPVGTATSYGLDGRGSSTRRFKIFLLSTSSRPVLGPTQLSIQWVPGALSLVVKRPGLEADHSHPSSAEIKNGGAIPHAPMLN
jgi:hypothetical protein